MSGANLLSCCAAGEQLYPPALGWARLPAEGKGEGKEDERKDARGKPEESPAKGQVSRVEARCPSGSGVTR